MDFRPHSYEFTTLPSERSDISPAARELARLAMDATSWLYSIRATESRRSRERRRCGWGKSPMDEWDRPGYLIRKQSEAAREKLRALTSEDAAVLRVPLFYLHEDDWGMGQQELPIHHTVVGSGSHVGRLSMPKGRG